MSITLPYQPMTLFVRTDGRGMTQLYNRAAMKTAVSSAIALSRFRLKEIIYCSLTERVYCDMEREK